MIAKIVKGASFIGMIKYMMKKREGEARVLYAEGVRADTTPQEMASDFGLQASMRPNVKKPVCHTVLSFSADDTKRLTDEAMTKIAKEYLQQMGYGDTQYLIVRHLDREHPHLHICINRIGNDGITITDSNEKYRSTKICRELTEQYQLKFGESKRAVKRERLRGGDQVRYAIYDTIQAVLPKCKNWEELVSALKQRGIEVSFKTKGNTDKVEGVIFTKSEVSFSGSHIDRSCSYSKLSATLQQNAQLLSNQRISESIELVEELNPSESFIDKLLDTNNPAVDVDELRFQRKLRNQANRKHKRRRL